MGHRWQACAGSSYADSREATDGGKPRGRFGERLKKNGSEKQRTGESQEEDLGSVWVREATDGGKPRGRFGERLKKNGSEKQRTGEAKRKIRGAFGSEKQRTGESQEEDLGSVWVREAIDGGKPRGRFGERLGQRSNGRGKAKMKIWGAFGSEKQRTGESQEEDLASVWVREATDGGRPRGRFAERLGQRSNGRGKAKRKIWGAFGSKKQRTGESQEEDLGSVWVREATDGGKRRGRFGERLGQRSNGRWKAKRKIWGAFGSEKQRTGESQEEDLGSVWVREATDGGKPRGKFGERLGQRSNGRGKPKRKIWGAFEKVWVREATDGGKPRGRFGERSTERRKAKRKICLGQRSNERGKRRGRFGERVGQRSNGRGKAKRKIWGTFGSEKQRTGESQEKDLGSVWVREATDGGKQRGRFGERLGQRSNGRGEPKRKIWGAFGSEKQWTGDSQEEDLGSVWVREATDGGKPRGRFGERFGQRSNGRWKAKRKVPATQSNVYERPEFRPVFTLSLLGGVPFLGGFPIEVSFPVWVGSLLSNLTGL